MAKLKLYSWNVNGIRAQQKKGLIDWVLEEKPDILCLQETKAHVEQLDDALVNIAGYESCFSSAEKKGYSGVAVYSKTKKIKPKKIEKGFGIKEFDSEGRTLYLDYGDFVLFNIYFPNGQRDAGRLQYKMDFYDAFLDFVNDLKKKKKKIIICGDVNTAHTEIDLARPKQNVKTSGFLEIERAWMDKFFSHGYIDTFRHFCKEGENYTYWDTFTRARERNVGWRIDYFFISPNLEKNLKKAYIMSEKMGSDHCPIGIELSV